MGRVGGSHGRKPRAGVGGLASRRSVFRGELTGASEEEGDQEWRWPGKCGHASKQEVAWGWEV